MDVTELFGRRVRSLRKDEGLTQEELADRAGINYKYLGAVERGEENPSLKIISSIAAGLGVEVRDLFELEHEETSPAKLRKKLDSLLKDADQATLQQAVKLIRALLV
jgi:transcriptional regulator with XRE-family HTH domain